MIFIVLLIKIVEGIQIFPYSTDQQIQIQWIQCEPPNNGCEFIGINQYPPYCVIDDKSICQGNIDTLEITQKYSGQLHYYFLFAKNIENELIISIDGIRYYVDVDQAPKIKNYVEILHEHQYLEGQKFPISIKGKNNQFQQLLIYEQGNINQQEQDQVNYKTSNYEYKSEISLLSLNSSILYENQISICFTYKIPKIEFSFPRFKIHDSINISIKTLNDSIVQLTSQFLIKEENKLQNLDFIFRVKGQTEITDIVGENNAHIDTFDLIIQTDKQNHSIQTFFDESNEKMILLSEMQVLNQPNNQILTIEIKPKGVECPSQNQIQLTHIQICKNKYVQFTQSQFQQINNCSITIQHSFTDQGQYLVQLSAKMQIQNLTFYFENSGSFSILGEEQIEFHLVMVILVFFGTIILFMCIFILLIKKYGGIIQSRWDIIYFKSVYIEEENLNLQ